MCITRQEYDALISSIDAVKEEQSNYHDERLQSNTHLQNEFNGIRNDISTLALLINGNGNPQKGLVFTVQLMSNELQKHLKDHEKTDDKLWDIAKPVIIMLVTATITAGIIFIASNTT